MAEAFDYIVEGLWPLAVPIESVHLDPANARMGHVVGRLMGDDRAVLFVTDPPYLVNYDGSNHPSGWDDAVGKHENYWDWDRQGGELYDGFVKVAIDLAVAQDAAWYCWHASQRQDLLMEVWARHGVLAHQQIIWVKDRSILGRGWFLWQHEPCLFGWLKGNKPRKVGEEYFSTVWEFATHPPGQRNAHPTSKPLGLFERPIFQHTVVGDLCYEPFAGSGSQLIACENTGRVCRAVEIAPAYVGVILERYWEAFGIEAEVIG